MPGASRSRAQGRLRPEQRKRRDSMFLPVAGRELAVAEQGTVTWYAFKISDTRYGIFDSFETEDARQAHLNGEIGRALSQVGPSLLASAPEIRTVDIVAVK